MSTWAPMAPTAEARFLAALPEGRWHPLLLVISRARLRRDTGLEALWELVRSHQLLARTVAKGDWNTNMIVVRKPRSGAA